MKLKKEKQKVCVLENKQREYWEPAYLIVAADEIDNYSIDDDLDFSDDPNEDSVRFFWNYWDGHNHKSEYVRLAEKIGDKNDELFFRSDDKIKWELLDDNEDEIDNIKEAYLRCRDKLGYDSHIQEIADVKSGYVCRFSAYDDHGWRAQVFLASDQRS